MNRSAGALTAPIPQLIKQAILAVEPDATILLYGSRARGDARPDSDWDVLVLVDRPPDRDRDREIQLAAGPIVLDLDADISVRVYSREVWDDPQRRRELFQINVERDAVPLTPYECRRAPATEEEMAEAREETVQVWLRYSHEALADADNAANGQRWRACMGRLYYAAFYVVTAYLLRQGLRYSRHTGVQRAFHQYLSRPGLVPPDLVKLYDGLLDGREDADYHPLIEFSAEEVEPWIEPTRRLVSIVAGLLTAAPEELA